MSSNTKNEFFPQTLKGVGIALICTLISVLLFAFVLKCATLDTKVVKIVNQFLKSLAIFLGCLFSLKGKQGLLKGGFLGLLWTLLTYVVFAILGGNALFTGEFFLDILFGIGVGILSGIVSVNMKSAD